MIYDYIPGEPGEPIDWLKFEKTYSWTTDMLNTPQDAQHHAEGDVWTHTKMVTDALVGLPAFWELDAIGKRVTFAAAVLHDKAKPATTVVQPDGRITSHGHSKRGSVDARLLLWGEKVPFAEREMVARLIGLHQYPFFAVTQPDREYKCRKLSHEVRLDWLALVAEADGLGRLTLPIEARQATLENVRKFREACRNDGILNSPYPFADDVTWMKYLDVKGEQCDPRFPIYNLAEGSRVMFMSGLAGMGKDTWIEKHAAGLSVISLDATRKAMNVKHGDNQGAVAQKVKDEARMLLRTKQPFVWNATNFTVAMREMTINLLRSYGAHITIVYVETSDEKKWRAQNNKRLAALPNKALDEMLFKWEPPTENEAHAVQYWVDGELVSVINPVASSFNNTASCDL